MKRTMEKRLGSLILAFALLCGMALPASAASEAAGTTIRLAEHSGTVTVKNAAGKNATVRNDMRLYNGYTIETGAKSYTHISLDGEKAVKLDGTTKVEVRKNGKKLEVALISGNLFFSVDAPLKADESFNVRTSSMVCGIRGSFGWVNPHEVGLIHGHAVVTCVNPVTGEVRTTELTSGQAVRYEPESETHVDEQLREIDFDKAAIANDEVPAIAAEEIAADPAKQTEIREDVPTIDVDELLKSVPEKREAEDKAQEDAQKRAEQAAAAQEQELSATEDRTYVFTPEDTADEDNSREPYVPPAPSPAPTPSPTPTTYSVTVESAANGTVTADKTDSLNAGDTVTLTVTPDSGYELDTLTVKDASGTAVALTGTGNTRTFAMPASNVTVTAAFKALGQASAPTFTPAAGTYTGSQSVTLACATDGAAIYYTTDGTMPTASSTAYIGAISVETSATIKAIAVKSGMRDSTVAEASYTINATVSFASGDGTGTMTDVTVEKGGTYSLPVCGFTAPAGKEFKAWSVGGEEKAPNSTITVGNNVTVTAVWELVVYTLTASATMNGSVSFSVNGAAATTAHYGKTVTLTVTPETSYQLDTLTVKDASGATVTLGGTGNTRTFTMPASNVTAAATFAAIPSTTVGPFVVTGGTQGTDYSYTSNVLTVLTAAPLIIKNTDPSTAVTTDRIEIANGVNADITLAGVNIDVSSASLPAFLIWTDSAGEVTITLAAGTTNMLKSGYVYAGLQKGGTKDVGKLTITGPGRLDATGGSSGAAGIGGSGYNGNAVNAYNIVITGGTINAYGNNNSNGGAGIGGGSGGKGEVTISGGTVIAVAGNNGAGIGGGHQGAGTVEITGGVVTATGGAGGGAGIGGGCQCAGKVTITGGQVTASGGDGGAGIGGGYGCGANDIKISGGKITAKGGDNPGYQGGAGIGGGGTGTAGTILIFGTNDFTGVTSGGQWKWDDSASAWVPANDADDAWIKPTAGTGTTNTPAEAIGRGGHN